MTYGMQEAAGRNREYLMAGRRPQGETGNALWHAGGRKEKQGMPYGSQETAGINRECLMAIRRPQGETGNEYKMLNTVTKTVW